MSKITLTQAQKKDLEHRHKKARDSRESDRIKAILLRSEGWTIPMIAQALRKHEVSISRHIQDYLKEEKLESAHLGNFQDSLNLYLSGPQQAAPAIFKRFFLHYQMTFVPLL